MDSVCFRQRFIFPVFTMADPWEYLQSISRLNSSRSQTSTFPRNIKKTSIHDHSQHTHRSQWLLQTTPHTTPASATALQNATARRLSSVTSSVASVRCPIDVPRGSHSTFQSTNSKRPSRIFAVSPDAEVSSAFSSPYTTLCGMCSRRDFKRFFLLRPLPDLTANAHNQEVLQKLVFLLQSTGNAEKARKTVTTIDVCYALKHASLSSAVRH